MVRTVWSAVVAAVAIVLAGAPASADDSIEAEARAAKARADASVAAMSASTARVRAQLRRARTTKRADQIACVDATLTRADVALRYGRDHATHAIEAYARGAVDDARREMTWLAARLEASHQARKEADACLADVDAFAGPDRTVIHLVVDPTLPRDWSTYPDAYPGFR
jgi:hypothetical protein